MHNLLKILLLSSLMSSFGMLCHRDYYDEMELSDFQGPIFMPGREFDVVSGDDGRAYRDQEDIYLRTPATEKDREHYSYQNSIKYELYALENRQSDNDYNDYMKVTNELNSDSERIYFLRLTTAKERQQYLQAKGITVEGASWSQTPFYNTPEQALSRNDSSNESSNWRRPSFDTSDTSDTSVTKKINLPKKAIELGMQTSDVTNAWGRPLKRDIAGMEGQGNERWTYQMGNRVKYIYFERGRVEGWSEQ